MSGNTERRGIAPASPIPAGVDALGRRPRARRVSSGKRVAPQPADLVWFRKLLEHGPLPSAYLLAYTRHLRRSDKRATERLTDLFNETETRHGGPYFDRPPQQFHTIDSRYNRLVYDLAPAAVKALRAADAHPKGVARPSGPWVHRFMVACVTASIELATLARSDVSYIAQHRILARAETELRHEVTIDDPVSRRRLTKDIIPDAVFGLEHHTPAGSRFRFFALECDRATEPAMSSNFNRKSWQRSLLQYREYAGRRRYRAHLQLTAPLLVLNVTSEPRRQQKMLQVAEDTLTPDEHAWLLFQTCPEFARVFRPPPPMPQLLEVAWSRPGRDPFRIDSV